MLIYFLLGPAHRTLFDELEDAWRLREELTYTFLGGNRYFVHFGWEADMVHVMKEGPWQFWHDPLIMEAYDGLCKVLDYKLDAIRIWVGILDVPTNWRTEPVVRALVKN